MAIKSAPYYWLECDNCHTPADYGIFTAWDTTEAATSNAWGDWTWAGDRHHCPACPRLFECTNCGKDAGQLAGERDYLCPDCYDAQEAAR